MVKKAAISKQILMQEMVRVRVLELDAQRVLPQRREDETSGQPQDRPDSHRMHRMQSECSFENHF